MKPASRKIVIIGGGVAGLCAGVYAQASGYQVEVLEQGSVPGGLATSWKRAGYTFETCLHWLVGSSPDGALGAQWREVCDLDKLTFVYPQEFQRLETEDGRALRIYSHVDQLEAEFLRESPRDAEEIRAFASAIRGLADFPMEALNEAWPRKGLALLRLIPKLPLLQHWASISAAEYGKRFEHELIRRFIVDGATSGMSVIALVFMFAWMSRKNAGYPIGGSRAVVRLIVERFRALGGTLRLMAKADEILVEDNVAVGVRLADGETIHADWVISAADGHATIYDLLGGKYRDEAIDQFYEKQHVFPSYLQVSIGVAQDLSAEPGLLSRCVTEPLRLDPETVLHDVPLRIFHYDPTFAPPGKTAVTAFLPTYNYAYWLDLERSDTKRYVAEKQRVAEAVIATLDRRMPGIRERIETIDVSTPASVVRFTGNWKGSMEGFLPTPGTGFGTRRQTLPGLGRFRMVGQWVQPGGGLPSGLMTARAAIRAICRNDHVPFVPKSASGVDQAA
ncbi:NAD(P)/FAD-dependent oxidoreductase [Mesorhizobium sp.]|uniref:phytoene desaturase family protein n=1 Tax=Mesorhizobium sp. TaxID=1871066 RepID=UPI00121E3EE4|nr:NAD(P)/FAD-dependent oxidoreductase [Mesorhizobium sp.]TIO75078.1 MAG: NAD(P)/FAD-dependent oxidoreductase [Mesorhizobium sp.]